MGKTTKIILARIWPLAILIIIWFIFSYSFFLKGLIPAPLDFLTNFYNPWQAYEDYPIKNPAIPDVVSQIIPWKIYSIDSFKKGIIPFWNPYNFAGTPHLANFQSAIFNPLNVLFFIFSFTTAWSLFILLQPLFAGIFTYLFTRKVGLSRQASLISSLSFAFCGFLTVWLEYGTLGWAIIWLPLTLFLWEHFWNSKNLYYWFAINLFFSFSLLSGHLQISLYLLFANLLYLIFNIFKKRKLTKRYLFLSISSFFLPFLLTSFQLLPTLEFYNHSPRSIQIPLEWFKGLQIPFSYLITFLFPDFFGNPVTRNLWGRGSYVEMMGYIGLLPILLIIFYLFKGEKKQSWFFIILAATSLLLALPTPLSNLLVYLKIPLFSSSAPSRIICLASFSFAILSGYAWDFFSQALKKQKLSELKFLFTSLILFLALLPIAFFINKITFRNLIFPFTIFIIFLLSVLIIKLKIKNINLIVQSCFLVFILLLALDLFRFWYKFNPFINKERFYPTLPIINFMKQNSGVYRTFDLFLGNLNLPFKINSPGGYDSLNITEYQQLLFASQNGNSVLPARTTGENIAKRGQYSKKLLDLAGVKYVAIGTGDVFYFPVWDYPQNFVSLWQDKNYSVYENTKVWPRFFLTNQYRIVPKEKFLQTTLKNKNYKEVILIEDPQLAFGKTEKAVINLEKYEENKVYFNSSSDSDNLLFLSDVFYPGWVAKIDGVKTKILKADYIFRSVKIPKGDHKIEFIYEPEIFKIGILVSFLTIFMMTFFIFFDKLFIKVPKAKQPSDSSPWLFPRRNKTLIK